MLMEEAKLLKQNEATLLTQLLQCRNYIRVSMDEQKFRKSEESEAATSSGLQQSNSKRHLSEETEPGVTRSQSGLELESGRVTRKIKYYDGISSSRGDEFEEDVQAEAAAGKPDLDRLGSARSEGRMGYDVPYW
jgi:hypothetical protein